MFWWLLLKTGDLFFCPSRSQKKAIASRDEAWVAFASSFSWPSAQPYHPASRVGRVRQALHLVCQPWGRFQGRCGKIERDAWSEDARAPGPRYWHLSRTSRALRSVFRWNHQTSDPGPARARPSLASCSQRCKQDVGRVLNAVRVFCDLRHAQITSGRARKSWHDKGDQGARGREAKIAKQNYRSENSYPRVLNSV